jgi:hypothetical protein
MTEAIETETLIFTDAAARKVGDLIRGEGNPNLKLRVFVQGGGCSGMQYGFEFDENETGRGYLRRKQGVKLLVDPDEHPVSDRRGDRLPRRSGWCAVRDSQSECADHVRMRFLVHGLKHKG